MTERPIGSLACSVLHREAKRAKENGFDKQTFVDTAPQWALDAITQKQLDAIIYLVWGSI